jgi:hypothetical protein
MATSPYIVMACKTWWHNRRHKKKEDQFRWQPFIRHGTVYKLMKKKPMIQIDRGTNGSEFL